MDKTKRPTCRYCTVTLRPWLLKDKGRYGYNGDGLFCTLRCGYQWARYQIERQR